MLKVDNLCYGVEQKEIISNICLEIDKGEFVGLIGPNGSGKSTLLKNIYKVLKPLGGTAYLKGKSILEMSNKEAAQEIAVVAQENNTGFDFSVNEIVLMGRHPYKRLFERETREDEEIVERALKRVGMDLMAERSFISLSGGEKQRVLIARALVQDTEFLILDEPTNHLDIGYQINIMDLIKNLEITTFAAIHDLNIAALYCDRLIVLNDGVIITSGVPNEVLTFELIKDLFGIEVEFYTNRRTGALQMSPMPSGNIGV
ncbi:MAG: ABC transporter ATP-binding protein [Saccharofermentanales bacterium]